MRILAAVFIALSFLILGSCEVASTPEMRTVLELKDIVNRGDQEALNKLLIDEKLEDGTEIISVLYQDEFVGPLSSLSMESIKSILNNLNLSSPQNLSVSALTSKTLVSEDKNFKKTYTPTNLSITDKVSGSSVSITVWKQTLEVKKNYRNIKQLQIDFSTNSGDYKEPRNMDDFFKLVTSYKIGNIVLN